MINKSHEEYLALTEDDKSLNNPAFASADAQGLTHEVIERFDRQLEYLGYQVEQYDTKGDFYFWRIVSL
jgi:hypothetical protein